MPRTKKRTRSAYGEGSISKEKNGKFFFYYRTPADGHSKRHKVTLMCPAEDGSGKSVPCTTMAQAEAAAQLIRDEISQLDNIKDHENAVVELAKTRKLISSLEHPLSSLWKTYLGMPSRPQGAGEGTMRDQERIINDFVAWCAKAKKITTLDGVSTDVILEYLNGVGLRLSARSYNSYLGTIKRVFQHTWRELGLDCNPAENIKRRPSQTKSRKELTQAQIEQILRGFDEGFFYTVNHKNADPDAPQELRQYTPLHAEEMRLLILLALFTGCRCKDGCLMRWKAIQSVDGRPMISYVPEKTKRTSGKVVTLPIHPLLLGALQQADGWRTEPRDNDDYLMPHIAERYLRNPDGIIKDTQKIIAIATGLEITGSKEGRARGAAQYGIHALRHSFVSFAANAGIPLEVVADIVGHGNPSMTEHYFHASAQSRQAAIDALPTFAVPGLTPATPPALPGAPSALPSHTRQNQQVNSDPDVAFLRLKIERMLDRMDINGLQKILEYMTSLSQH